MSIAVEKKLNASERFMLVRLEPARYIAPTSIGGGVYQMTFPYVLSGITRNGTALTKVSSVSNNDEYSFNEATGVLQVKLASAPSTSNVLIATYYLFYTGTKNRAIYETPTDSGTTIRNWIPRITRYPSFYQSFANLRAGIMSIADSSLSLISDNREFQAYLSDDDSFSNKRVDIWLCINDISNIKKIYTGTITGLRISNNIVKIDITDQFNKLKQSAYMGDSDTEARFTRESGSFPSMDAKRSGTPCPYIVSPRSRQATQIYTKGSATFRLVVEGTKAVPTNFSDTKSVTTNREYGLCRSGGNVTTQAAMSSVSSVTLLSGSSVYRITHSGGSFEVGDTFHYTLTGTDHYGIVVAVGSGTIDVAATTAAPTTSLVHVAEPHISVVIRNLPYEEFSESPHNICIPFYDRDYTLTTATTSGGNKYHKITFVDDFEANFSATNPLGPAGFTLDPDLYEIHFALSLAVNEATVELRKILLKAGLEVDSASFNGGVPLFASPAFHIPNIDEFDYDFYLKYVEDMLHSLLCFLRVQDDGKVYLEAWNVPSSTDTRDSSLILDGETSVDVDYQDIVTKIIAYNPHLDPSDTAAINITQNLKSRYLHGLENVDRFKHCMKYLSERISAHIGLKSERVAKYRYSVATVDVDTELGDDILLSNRIVLGSSTNKSVKITALDKSPSGVSVEASDMLGITLLE